MLWDIDHTLMETGGVGASVYRAAFETATGLPMRERADVTGGTEPALSRANLRLNGLDDVDVDGLFARFATEQARQYRERRRELRARGRALPGAQSMLEAVAEREDVVQTVLTCNTRPSAQLKLEAFGLDTYLDLESGAYGTDADDRAELIGIAQHRASQHHGVAFPPSSTVLLADTLADMKAGRRTGIRVIGMATGKSTLSDLQAGGADVALPGLTDLRTVLAAILGS